jgi:hypothetical protein
MIRLCSYIVRQDTGFAPNPFGRYCTLSACTPNHQGIRLQRGDWIVGHEPLSRRNKVVYAMKLSEVINFDDYFSGIRFEYKKPRRGGEWRTQREDNIYHRERGEWKQEWSPFHKKEQFRQDTKIIPRYLLQKSSSILARTLHQFRPGFQRLSVGVRDVAVPIHRHW